MEVQNTGRSTEDLIRNIKLSHQAKTNLPSDGIIVRPEPVEYFQYGSWMSEERSMTKEEKAVRQLEKIVMKRVLSEAKDAPVPDVAQYYPLDKSDIMVSDFSSPSLVCEHFEADPQAVEPN